MTASASVVAVVSDLIFATKITSTAATLGVTVKVVRSLDQLSTRLSEDADAMVLVDLEADGLDGVAAVSLCRESDRKVIAFGSHVRTDLLAAARDAGADEVLPRSAFATRLAALLKG